MAEVHIVGQILQAKDFPKQDLFCKWYLQIGNNWKVISGRSEGQTQVNSSPIDNTSKWCYPIDIHLATAGLQGWPKIYIQVYHSDWLGRIHFYGYGFITIPTSPGQHTLDCYTWRPFGTIRERFIQYFLGGGLQLTNPDLIFSSNDRYKLSTEAMGVVSFELSVVLSLENVTLLDTNITISNTSSTLTTISNNLTTCKMNESCAINTTTTQLTTISLNSTTIAPPTTQIYKNKTNNLHETINKNLISRSTNTKHTCICDLQINYCDINCCCDKDCSYDNKLIFGHCYEDEEYFDYDPRLCIYNKYVYVNYTRTLKQINRNSVFCVMRTNLPAKRTKQREDPLKSFSDGESEKLDKYSWPKILDNDDDLFKFLKNYTYGSPIWTFYNNKTLKKFEIPQRFITDKCLIREAIKFLINFKSNCNHQQVAINDDLKIDSFYRNFTIISQPELFNSTLIRTKGCPKNVCIPIEPRICTDFFQNCIKMPKNLTTTCNKNLCENLVKNLKYNIYHNGTKGIIKIDLLLILINSPLENLNFYQNFEIEFIWIKYNLNFSTHLSGNPGYLTGKPILIANLIETLNNSNNNNNNNTTILKQSLIKFQRNPLSFSDNFMVIFKNLDGFCVLNSTVFSPIEFNYNLYSNCKLQILIDDIKNKTATFLCRKIQREIFEKWSLNITNDTLTNRFIGKFGNANVYKKDDWISILYKQDLNDTLNNINGSFIDNKTLECYNLTTLFIIDVFYSRIDVGDVLNQAKILGVTVQFDNCKNFTFIIDEKSIDAYTKIGVQVMFYDITTKKIRTLVDPPSLTIELPYDFFYPFVKISNNSNVICSLIFLVQFCVILILFV